MFCIKPYHLPILISMSLFLFACSDARVPRKPHIGSGPPKLLHHHKTHTAHNYTQPTASPDANHRMMAHVLTNHLSGTLAEQQDSANTTATTVEGELHGDFDELNILTKGFLSTTLSELLEWKLLELQAAVRNARKAKDTFDQMTLAADAVACPLCSHHDPH